MAGCQLAVAVPANSALPVITGTPQVGQTLTGRHGIWTNGPTSYTDQWYRAGTAIPGATSLTYSPQTADVGSTLMLGEFATNAVGSSFLVMSVATAPVTAPSPSVPVNISPPTITGTPQVGQTLIGAHGSWTNSPTSFSDQWYRAGAAIPGATSLMYSPQTADVGSTLTLGEVAANAAGSSAQAMSAATAPVTSPPATGLLNGSFEVPAIASYAYGPSGGNWTFISSAGIQHNGSAWGAPNAPDGVQTAFLQDGTTGGNGTISQLFSLPAAGTYAVSFYSALRAYRTSPTIMSFIVTMDGTNIGAFSPTSTSFSLFTTSPIVLSAGSHTLSFVGTGAAPDTADFIDFVTLNSTSAQLPPSNTAPPTITGTPQVGQTLIGAHGSWTNAPTSYTDQWYRAGAPISGATSLTYAPQTADVGLTLTLGEIATNAAGSSAQAISAATAPVTSPPASGIVNGSFEVPAIGAGSIVLEPAGATWVFTISAGIQSNGSAFGAPNAVSGTQTAYLQCGANPRCALSGGR